MLVSGRVTHTIHVDKYTSRMDGMGKGISPNATPPQEIRPW